MNSSQANNDSSSSPCTPSSPSEESWLNPEDVRQRAVSGAAVDLLRGAGVQILGFIGTLILARLLTPYEFGIVAFGATLVTFANFMADGGIGTALIRRPDPPSSADLKALLAFQLALTVLLALAVSLALLPFGEIGQVTALMLITLPFTAIRSPGTIILERQLNYKPLALIEVVETIAYYAWAIVTVRIGWGVWGLASATIVRALVGSVAFLAMVPAARLLPIPSWTRVRVLLGFGFRYQAVGVTILLRDQGINAVVAAVAGVSALGVWSIALRILQVPLLFLASLWRVSFPGMARLVAAKGDMGATIERVVAVVAVAAGLLLAPLVSAAPSWVPSLLGEQWDEAATVIPPASLNLMIAGSISVALVGYLWAVGDASAVLRATLVGIPFMAAVMIPLLILIGVEAVGFGWMASGVAESVILIRSARKRVGFRLRPRLVPPTLFAVLGASVGWLVSSEVGPTLAGGLAGGLSAGVLYLLGLWLFHRSYLLDSVRLSFRGVRAAFRPSV